MIDEHNSDWTKRAFLIFLIAHVCVWTFIPALIWPNLSLDQSETVFWGREWLLGTTKHPPLTSWICEAATLLFGRVIWAQYFVAQLAIGLGLYAVWRLARQIVSPVVALYCVCLLECSLFFTSKSLHLNNNVGLVPCWSWCLYCLFLAIRTQRTKYWIATGIWLGLGMLVKYTTGVLAVVVLAFGMFNADARRSWRQPGPYIAILLSILIFLPHLNWLVAHQFCTVYYASTQTSHADNLLGHVSNPFAFGIFQVANLAPVFLALALLNRWQLPRRRPEESDQFPRAFVSTMLWAPVLIHFAVSAIFNLRINGNYGLPLWLLIGIWLMQSYEFVQDDSGWRRGWFAWATLAAANLVVFGVSATLEPIFNSRMRSVFPGPDLAESVDRVWRDRFGGPVPTVAGNYFLSGNISFFSASRPRVYQTVDNQIEFLGQGTCPWMTPEEFRQTGGIFVWDRAGLPKGIPAEILDRFGATERVDLSPLRYRSPLVERQAHIGIAILPPAGQQAVNSPQQTVH